MYYDVLINYKKPGDHIDTWYAYSDFLTYSEVVSRFKKEINSIYNFVYVRKRFNDKKCNPCITCFKLVTHTSYTFNHFPKVTDVANSYLVHRYLEARKNDD